MPTPKKKAPVNKIDLNVAVERKLIDSKIVLPQETLPHRLLKIVVYAVIFGGLAGAAVVFYLKISQTDPVPESYIPDIIVPDESEKVVQPSPTPEETIPAPTPVQIVEILDTPTGTLNVRKGPGTNFAKIDEIKPGDAFILVSTNEAAGWYEIKLADGLTGWVTKQYARVK